MNIKKKCVIDIQMKKQISENTFDIVQLIEKNPITRLNKNYENKFIQKIKNNFTESQQQMFASSFYSYLNYNSKTDFVIDMDLVWKWLGFDRKGKCKELLVKHFTIDIDYKIKQNNKIYEVKTASETCEAGSSSHNLCGDILNKNLSQIKDAKGFSPGGEKPKIVTNLGGRPNEQILLNIHTFKRLCLKSNAKKADEVHEYFIKLEEIFQEILNEESVELRNQLQNTEEKLKKETSLKNQILRRKYFDAEPGDLVYAYKDNEKDNNSEIKIGKSKGVKGREEDYTAMNRTGKMIYIKRCLNCNLTERVLHHILDKYRINSMQEWLPEASKLAFAYAHLKIIELKFFSINFYKFL
jgi:hypothetical protein